ncbi:MAG: UbiA family prenyltransferase [Bryobacterales bacterium]|nr:UbiA family prenyltransferase [Bryobacterales bacterium]
MRQTSTDGSPGVSGSGSQVPLAVDLDGTLLRGDSLWEAVAILLRTRPWLLLLFPFWLVRGKAAFKARLAGEVSLDPSLLVWNEELVTFLRGQHAAGRPLFLVTGANQRWAEQIGAHFGFFQQAIGSDDANNTGSRKGERCAALSGENGFDYVGDSMADLPVMRAARRALIAGANSRLHRRVQAAGIPIAGVFPSPSGWGAVWRTLRMHQWPKNLLLFVPAFVGMRWMNGAVMLAASWAMASFCLAASACYLINDLADLPSDRRHPAKRLRPFASGEMPLAFGFLAMPLLIAGALVIAWQLPARFTWLVVIYLGGALAYSFRLKRLLMADVMVLAGLYTVRILAGGAATGIVVSPWLLLFSVCVFSSLAFLKRFIEFQDSGTESASRAYETDDAPLLAAMGIGSAMISILVLALYINSDSVRILYHEPHFLWPACPLLMYYLNRLWLLARRRELTHDPVWFVIRDKAAYVVLALVALSMQLARAV